MSGNAADPPPNPSSPPGSRAPVAAPAGSQPPKGGRARKATLAVVAVVVIATVGVWGGVYHFSLGSGNPCAGVNLGPGFSSSASPATEGGRALANPAEFATSAAGSAVSAALVASPAPPTATPAPPLSPAADFVIPVVAAENVWGSLVGQIGGKWTSVTSIITDPNTDPHEYQANDSDAEAIADARYIVVNNVGYDTWATELIAADGASAGSQTVLNIGDSLGVKVTGGIVTGNPHLWYNPTYVNDTIKWMELNLSAIEPSLSTYFADNYENLTVSLGQNYSEIGIIRHDFSGALVAATESIFVYLANATGLDLVSPPAFMEAVAEDNDPPLQSVVEFQCQLESGKVQVLVFNAQTVTPITTSMKTIAAENNVSVVSVTESVVPPYTNGHPTYYQVWFHSQLQYLYIALDAHKLGE